MYELNPKLKYVDKLSKMSFHGIIWFVLIYIIITSYSYIKLLKGHFHKWPNLTQIII